MDKTLLTRDQLATFLGVPANWVRHHSTQLPQVRLGKYVRFDAEAVVKALTKEPLRSYGTRCTDSTTPSEGARDHGEVR